MDSDIGKVCPFCKTEIKEGDTVKVCPACGIPHHERCWEENKGCTTPGCPYESLETPSPAVCSTCGALLADGQEFCTKCGTPRNAPKKNVCEKCGAELQAGQEYCPKCGQKIGLATSLEEHSVYDQSDAGKGKKKLQTMPIIIAAVAVVVIAAGFFAFRTISAKKTKEAISEYKTSAFTFYLSVLTDSAVLERIGNDEVGYWHDYIYDDAYSSIETAVLKAQLDHSDDISEIEENYDSISSKYKNLLELPEKSGSDLEEIKDAVKNAYDAYVDFYDTVMNVTGSYNSFSEDFHNTDNAMSSAIKKLGILVS